MSPAFRLLILATVIWADLSLLPEGYIKTDNKILGSGCHHPFINVGNRCYLFSEEELNFEDATKYCEGLSNGQVVDVTLAMFDYSKNEDQYLLDAITERNQTFWIGGKYEEGSHWMWLDDREINLKTSFWYNTEPNEIENECLVAHTYNYNDVHTRTYLYDNNCADSLNFICQTGCPIHFRLLGDYCYMTSTDIGIPNLPWFDARDYCQSLSVYEGYHADLAVLDLPGQNDIELRQQLITDDAQDTWIGGVKKGEECKFEWIDGRELDIGSLLWRSEEPDCGGQNCVDLSSEMYTGEAYVKSSRRYINEHSDHIHQPFVCQMFKNT